MTSRLIVPEGIAFVLARSAKDSLVALVAKADQIAADLVREVEGERGSHQGGRA